jgi:hypothetical protein
VTDIVEGQKMFEQKDTNDSQERAYEQATSEAGEVRAWEQIEPGRYMPRRIRGSFRGGKLG